MSSNPTRPFVVREGDGAFQSNQDLSTLLNEWLTKSGPNSIFRTCGGCKNMVRTGPAKCNLYNSVPPIDIILSGCDAWVDDMQIPL